MMTSILHKILSTGTVAAKVVMGEVLLEVPEGSKACMVNHIKGTGRPHRRATSSIPPLQRMRAPSHSNTRHLVETALLPRFLATMGVLGLRNHPTTLSNILALVLATMVACLMYLGVPSRISQRRIRGLVPTWVNRVVMRTKSATIAIRPKYLAVQVQH